MGRSGGKCSRWKGAWLEGMERQLLSSSQLSPAETGTLDDLSICQKKLEIQPLVHTGKQLCVG